MRVLVTGRDGQVTRAVAAKGASLGWEVIAVGRPDFDLETPGNIASLIEAIRPQVVVNPAAYTAVDAAEGDAERCHRVNATGAGVVARAAAAAGLPIIHVSTDYVFDGRKAQPYVEEDPVGPQSVYGATKLAGEREVAAANPAHVILRTAWVYSSEGKNFVTTMLRLATDRSILRVVGDQHGNPTAASDIAAAVMQIAQNLVANPGPEAYGVFHLSGTGEASWAQFAERIFQGAAARGLPKASVEAIPGSDYPTPARRPGNSRLDCAKVGRVHRVVMPDWRCSLETCLDEIARAKPGREEDK
jgi:dTDP-4-dehydrorhamnose reductase